MMSHFVGFLAFKFKELGTLLGDHCSAIRFGGLFAWLVCGDESNRLFAFAVEGHKGPASKRVRPFAMEFRNTVVAKDGESATRFVVFFGVQGAGRCLKAVMVGVVADSGVDSLVHGGFKGVEIVFCKAAKVDIQSFELGTCLVQTARWGAGVETIDVDE